MARPLLQASGYDVILAVNSLRIANGLPTYTNDDALLAAAPSRSDWQASTGKASHSGANGSSPKGRAIAAGYSSVPAAFVSENIASGINMCPTNAVEIWQVDSLHLTTMLSPNYTVSGAGVSSDGRVTYIALDVGFVSEQAVSTVTQPPPAQSASPAPTVSPPAGQTSKGFIVAPVVTVTAQTDGSIVHIVQPGEVLLNIALAYGVKLNDLYQLNFLTAQSVIYPGQKIKIKGPDPTATPTETPTPTRAPTATRRPTRTPAPSPTLTPGALVTSTSPAIPNTAVTSGPDILLIAIGVLLVVGIGMVAAGMLLKRK